MQHETPISRGYDWAVEFHAFTPQHLVTLMVLVGERYRVDFKTRNGKKEQLEKMAEKFDFKAQKVMRDVTERDIPLFTAITRKNKARKQNKNTDVSIFQQTKEVMSSAQATIQALRYSVMAHLKCIRMMG